MTWNNRYRITENAEKWHEWQNWQNDLNWPKLTMKDVELLRRTKNDLEWLMLT